MLSVTDSCRLTHCPAPLQNMTRSDFSASRMSGYAKVEAPCRIVDKRAACVNTHAAVAACAPAVRPPRRLLSFQGWVVNSDSSEWSHAGSLPGTASLLMRRKTGPIVISVVTNARGGDGFFTDLYALARAVYSSFSAWPCSSVGWAYS